MKTIKKAISTLLIIAALLNALSMTKQTQAKEKIEQPPSETIELISENIEIAEANTIELALPENADGSFKTYMDYRAITNKNSVQYKMQQTAQTNPDGFRIYDDCYMVAVGTYYAQNCGIKLLVTLEDGTVLNCIVGDIKSDKHTDATNRYMTQDGNIVEFIVDTKKISSLSKKMGDMSYSGLMGAIKKIEVVL